MVLFNAKSGKVTESKMALSFKTIQPSEIEELLDFENQKLQSAIPDEMERSMASWSARWRGEALEQYLPLGWSFCARDPNIKSDWSNEGLLMGYFIAQPLLFFEGQTQSLWVEHIQYSSLQARDELVDLAYRLSREKHFQRVYFPKTSGVETAVATLKGLSWQPETLLIKTTKVSS